MSYFPVGVSSNFNSILAAPPWDYFYWLYGMLDVSFSVDTEAAEAVAIDVNVH